MKIIMTNPCTKKKWMIKPESNGLCFQVFHEPDKKDAKHDWYTSGKYPCTLDDAIRTALDLMMKEDDTEFKVSLSTMRTLTKSYKEIVNEFVKGIIVRIEK